MQRIAIGVIVGLAAWFGSTLAAEAQSTITSTGPLAIHTGDTTGTYTANITLLTLQDYHVQLSVYRGSSGTPFHTSDTWFYSPTSLTNTFSKLVTWSPQAFLGNKFTFKAKLLLTNPVQTINAADWVVITTNPGTYLMPSGPSDLAFDAIDRDRRHEA